MQNLLNELKTLLATQPRFTQEGRMIKQAVIDAAQSLDPELLQLLIGHDAIKRHFFQEVGNILVFDKVKLLRFVSNKAFLEDSYTAFKNKIGLVTKNSDGTYDAYLSDTKEVVLAYPYKDCMLEGGQTKEEQKRTEIFWNETLAPDDIDRLKEPKAFSNIKRYDTEGVHENITDLSLNDNYIIKGNNLLALYSLLPVYRGKVKLIYIDPPYNTGGDKNIFSYNNSFNHSTWLTFMKDRLKVAKEFLTNDGFITIAIDHAELLYLGVIADEIFGRENRIAIITILHNPKGRNQAKFFSENSEFMLVYAKNEKSAEFNSIAIDEEILSSFTEKDEKGNFRWEKYLRARTVWSREARPKNWYPIYVSQDLKIVTSNKNSDYHELYPRTASGDFSWKNIKETFDTLNNNDYFQAKEENGKVVIYHKFYEQQVFKNVWTDKKYQSEFNGTNLLKKIIGDNEFSYPKSLYAVIDVIKIMTKRDDIILDFFGGSGTTFHAVMEVNKELKSQRKFIIVEQLDQHIKVIEKRFLKLIENSKENVVFMELAKANQHFIDAIQAADTEAELLAIWERMAQEAFISYRIDLNRKSDYFGKDYEALSFENKKRFLKECLCENMLYVPYCDMESAEFGMSENDKVTTQTFYDLKNQAQ